MTNARTRRATHIARQAEQRERKRIRRARAAIHAAYAEAHRMRRSKRKGMSDITANVERIIGRPMSNSRAKGVDRWLSR
jgi:hypothetical protein